MKRKYIINWDGPVAGYAHNFTSKNYWRVSRIMEMEDTRQEAYVVFLKVKKAYGSKIDNGAWFMSLYKRALSNRFNDLSDKNTAVSAEAMGAIVPDSKTLDRSLLMTMIEEAPEEVKSVLSLFLEAPKELLDLAVNAWEQDGKKKIHGNQFLCKMLGHDSLKTDLPKQVKTYFK